MILIYCKDESGKIRTCTAPPMAWTLRQLQRKIEDYRASHDEKLRVYMRLVAEI